MTVFAIVPVKGLEEAKSRLSPFINPEERGVVTLAMLSHVLTTVREAPGVERVGVVSPSPRVLTMAEDIDASALREEGRGLNSALEQGRDWALSEGASSLLVLPADLPYLSTFDVWMLLNLRRDHDRAVVISPDKARKGTNALLLRPPNALPFAFGPGSYETHLRVAEERELAIATYENTSIVSDVDTYKDLKPFLREWKKLFS
jgi:2-phospho-L-lactate guanylyltransferase